MNNVKRKEEGIQMSLFEYFGDAEAFTLEDAQDAVFNHYNKDVKEPSIRARIYEGIDSGLFKRIAKGVYTVTRENEMGVESTCMLINGDGRDLSMIEDNSIDALITDHPYKLDKALKGGNRDFATYELFQYNEKDFNEKLRVLKPGAFLLEFLPEESEVNFEYLYQVKKMAIKAGFQYFAKVPWKKGDFVANTGRTKKNREDIMFFTKGEARALKLNAKKNKATAIQNGLDVKGLDSYGLRNLLEEHGLEVAFMKGTAGMLPTEFDYQPRNKKEKIMEAEKPVELFDAILPYITKPGEKVLDQFAGSGNLGISAVMNGRDAVLIEKDKEMYEKAKANLENAIKKKGQLKKEVDEIYNEVMRQVDADKKVYNAKAKMQRIDVLVDELKESTAEIDCYRGVMKMANEKMQQDMEKDYEDVKRQRDAVAMKNCDGPEMSEKASLSQVMSAAKEQRDLKQAKKMDEYKGHMIRIERAKSWSKVFNDGVELKRVYVDLKYDDISLKIYFDKNQNQWRSKEKLPEGIEMDLIEKKLFNVLKMNEKEFKSYQGKEIGYMNKELIAR